MTNLLQHVIMNTPDSLLEKSLQELHLVPEIAIENHNIHLTLSANYPIAFLVESLKQRLALALPDYQIHISTQQRIRSHQTQLPGYSLRGVKNIIAVASGKGGVGKSTVAVNLAAALARLGARVGILDADIYGPSIPLMLGPHAPVLVVDDKYIPINVHGIQAMSIGYLASDNTALIWRGPMLAKSLMQLLDITLWDDLDYLCVDLPPGTGDIQLSLVQKIPLAGAVIVTTPQNVATLDAEKAMQLFAKTNIHTLGVIENMASYHCSHCGHKEAIFGEGGAEQLANQHACALLGSLPLDTRIRSRGDAGQPAALSAEASLAKPFLSTAWNVVSVLSQRPLNYADKLPPVRREA